MGRAASVRIALPYKRKSGTTQWSPPTSKQTLSGAVGISSAFTAEQEPTGATAT
jgi:hypothetical protein